MDYIKIIILGVEREWKMSKSTYAHVAELVRKSL
jgi:hypothetical protein